MLIGGEWHIPSSNHVRCRWVFVSGKEFESQAFQIIDKAAYENVDFQLPIDHVIADSFLAKKQKLKQ